MKRILAIVALLALVGTAAAQQRVGPIDWRNIPSATVTAAGTDQAGATEVCAARSAVTTTPPNAGVKLCASLPLNFEMIITNQGLNQLKIYPMAGAQIAGGGTNAPVLLDRGGISRFFCTSSTECF